MRAAGAAQEGSNFIKYYDPMVRMPLWIAMALVGVTLAMGGCGSSDGGGGGGGGLTEPLPSETREQEKISGPSAPIWHFLERNYGSEDWFDNVREISFIDGYTTVSTFLKFHPRANHRDATAVCAAVMEDKQVDIASVLWGRSETMDCATGKSS